MINCPKCGFSQPEDQYCANCGVDMQHYRPPSLPLRTRLLRNPLVHIILLLLILAGVISTISYEQESELEQRIVFLETGRQKKTFRAAQTTPATNETLEEAAPEVEETEFDEPQGSKRARFEQSQAPAQDAQLRIKLVEADLSSIQQFVDLAQSNGNFYVSAEMAIGVIPVGKNLAGNTKKSWVSDLKGKETRELEYFAGQEESESLPEIGIRIYLQVQPGPQSSRIEVEVVRNLPLFEGESVFSDRQAIRETIQIKNGEGLFVTGLLPPTDTVDVEQQDSYPSIFSGIFAEDEKGLALLVQFATSH